ncbi:class I glutamine amidotransferase-like protein [Lindgomyces ingoldianus]|uniref:Class I glutamine amidotransferase-like protein n=1 Tax=Lindgomyces ingoldianus TaxID=673940 RepID=A0ACB6RH92_9PLEO|nr:class I glutamine amidotransferase-like protein [Lindgomyces ingoldianus]KAF2477697.1 class I glutamine amidotransferase-like protein [Lindgomyces ingoldianus]
MGAKFILGACLWIFSLVFAESTAFANGIKPQSYGIVLFRAFDTLDVYAPIEVLQMVSNMHKIDIFLISETNDPVTTAPMSAMMNPYNSSVWYTLPTAHTFETAPKEFDVLIVPGGPGIRSPYLNSTLKYIRETTPNAKHVITICTGAGLAARAGILNGKKATTNKTSWPNIIPFGPNTTWIPHARWVIDESGTPPIWSSSGVTAGLDLMLSFVETYYGKENATFIAKLMEYERHTDPSWDPFARNETTATAGSR